MPDYIWEYMNHVGTTFEQNGCKILWMVMIRDE